MTTDSGISGAVDCLCTRSWLCAYCVQSRVYATVGRPSVYVCLSVSPIRPLNAAAAGLLLWVRRTRDIGRLLQQRLATGECGQCHVVSVRSSWTQTCYISTFIVVFCCCTPCTSSLRMIQCSVFSRLCWFGEPRAHCGWLYWRSNAMWINSVRTTIALLMATQQCA